MPKICAGYIFPEMCDVCCRSAIEGVSASVEGDDESSLEQPLPGGEHGAGSGREVAEAGGVHNPIYGSREVIAVDTST